MTIVDGRGRARLPSRLTATAAVGTYHDHPLACLVARALLSADRTIGGDGVAFAPDDRVRRPTRGAYDALFFADVREAAVAPSLSGVRHLLSGRRVLVGPAIVACDGCRSATLIDTPLQGPSLLRGVASGVTLL